MYIIIQENGKKSLTRNFRIQDGCQLGHFGSDFHQYRTRPRFMVIHNISGFEDDRTKIVNCRALTRQPDGRTDARQTTTKTRGYSISPNGLRPSGLKTHEPFWFR